MFHFTPFPNFYLVLVKELVYLGEPRAF